MEESHAHDARELTRPVLRTAVPYKAAKAKGVHAICRGAVKHTRAVNDGVFNTSPVARITKEANIRYVRDVYNKIADDMALSIKRPRECTSACFVGAADGTESRRIVGHVNVPKKAHGLSFIAHSFDVDVFDKFDELRSVPYPYDVSLLKIEDDVVRWHSGGVACLPVFGAPPCPVAGVCDVGVHNGGVVFEDGACG